MREKFILMGLSGLRIISARVPISLSGSNLKLYLRTIATITKSICIMAIF